MIILFNIDYKVENGEEVCLNIKCTDGAACAEPCRSIKYMSNDNGHFSYNLRIEQKELKRIFPDGYLDYYYSVDSHCTVDVPPSEEWRRRGIEWRTVMHRIDVGQTGMDRYTVYDHWQYRPEDAHLYTPAFTECLQHRELKKPHHRPSPSILRLKVRAPQLRSNERLMLVGAHPVLGEWDTRRAIPCIEQQPNEWVACIDTEYTANEDIEYKFVVAGHDYILWETQNNRRVLVPRLRKGEVMEYEVNQAYFDIWNVRKAGTSVSLRDIDEIGGIGITNLKRMVDWIEFTKQKVLLIHSVPEHLSGILEKRLVELHRYAKSKGIMIITETESPQHIKEAPSQSRRLGDATITPKGIALSSDCILPSQVMTQQRPTPRGNGFASAYNLDGFQYMMIGIDTPPYLNPDHYPYLSICTIDTHDSSALTRWWEEDKERTQHFYSEIMGRRDEAPHPLPSWLARDIISRNLHSGSIFCIFSLDDWKLISSAPESAEGSLKGLLHNPRFCDDIAELIKQSGRI